MGSKHREHQVPPVARKAEIYGWCFVTPTSVVPAAPPCGIGPMFVKAKSKKQAARKYWREFNDIVNSQLCGISVAAYRAINRRLGDHMKDNDNFGCILGLILGFGVCILFGVGMTGGCGRGYSDGDRSGVVVKLSRKGVIWKSWEGEMRLGGDQNVTSGSWVFSVRDDSLVSPLQSSLNTGKRVTVHYTQWLHQPIEMESDYEVLKVTTSENKP